MVLVALVIGLVLLVAAIRNSQAALFTALGTDAPGFALWGAAVVLVGALGYVPAFKTPSRALLALVIIVIVLNNYKTIVSGLASLATSGASAGTSASSPASSSGSLSAAGGAAASNSGSPISLSDLENGVNALTTAAGG